MQTFRYDPTNMEPYPTLISKQEIDRKQSLSDSLSNYDSNLSFSDLKLLNLQRGRSRDASKFYVHCHQPLYLRTRLMTDPTENKNFVEWTNVTEDYEWDKIISNPDIPMYKFRKGYKEYKTPIVKVCLNWLMRANPFAKN